jgi:hypothetical protein
MPKKTLKYLHGQMALTEGEILRNFQLRASSSVTGHPSSSFPLPTSRFPSPVIGHRSPFIGHPSSLFHLPTFFTIFKS